MGADLSGVRVHEGAAADELCSAFGARAFTLGTDIVIADGAYAPGTAAGRHLLAHELAHVVQQGGRPAPPSQRLEIGVAADPAEREADSVARSAVARGRRRMAHLFPRGTAAFVRDGRVSFSAISRAR